MRTKLQTPLGAGGPTGAEEEKEEEELTFLKYQQNGHDEESRDVCMRSHRTRETSEISRKEEGASAGRYLTALKFPHERLLPSLLHQRL